MPSAADVVAAVIPGGGPAPAQAADAARLLDQAVQAGAREPEVAYLLALAYKRQGKTAEARQALRRIEPPDADVLLQLGLLSLQEGQLAQAEREFAQAFERDSTSYDIGYNLVMTRLALGQTEPCLSALSRVVELAASAEEGRVLVLLQLLLQGAAGPEDSESGPSPVARLRTMATEDEGRLLHLLRNLGELDVVLPLLKTLRAARPDSAPVQAATVEAILARAKALADRCDWLEAERLLNPLARDKALVQALPRPLQVAFSNLLGCVACIDQDPDNGLRHLGAALKLSPNDPRLHQNLALAYEWQGDPAKAEPHWNRFFDLLDRRLPAPPDQPGYHERVAFEGLVRLANRYTEREQWAEALGYVERARQLRPDDGDVLERLFHLYHHLKRPRDARQALARLRELRPNEPQLELYELDLIDVKTLPDIDRLLTEIDRIRRHYPDDARVDERAVTMVGGIIPLMANLCDQLTDQMHKVMDQVRHLPNYQINWPAVHDVMRDLQREFRKLRRITSKCLPLVRSDDHQRIVRDLSEHLDRKIEACRQMGG